MVSSGDAAQFRMGEAVNGCVSKPVLTWSGVRVYLDHSSVSRSPYCSGEPLGVVVSGLWGICLMAEIGQGLSVAGRALQAYPQRAGLVTICVCRSRFHKLSCSKPFAGAGGDSVCCGCSVLLVH